MECKKAQWAIIIIYYLSKKHAYTEQRPVCELCQTVSSPKDLTIQLLSRSWKMQDRMKTDGWMILIQYLKYRTQWCRCLFRCYLKEETEYLGIVSFIHKYYKFYIIWETILNIQGGLKEGVKADSLKWDKGQSSEEQGPNIVRKSGGEPDQGWSQGKINPKGIHKVWWKRIARVFFCFV